MGGSAAILLAAAIGSTGVAGASAETAPASLSRIEIAGPVVMVTDLDRSLRFYTEGLGLAIGTRLPGPAPGATIVAPGAGPAPFILLRQRDNRARTLPPLDLGNGLSRIMLGVSDAAGVAARLRAAGYAPTAVNDRKIFFVKDDDGYSYEVMETPAVRSRP